MLKWCAFLLAILAGLWIFIQRESISWESLVAGASLSSAVGVILMLMKTADKPLERAAKNQETIAWQIRLEEAEAKASQTIDGLNQEVQKLQQRADRSEQRCLSYQKLVDVHQHEIEKLRQENQMVAEQLIQKERKLSELHLARVEPDLFDSQRRQTETMNRELKKQLSEKQSLLHETRSHLSQTQHERLADVSELLEQLQSSKEEKEKLQSELISLKQLVNELSLQKDPKKTTRKKKSTEELTPRDLLA